MLAMLIEIIILKMIMIIHLHDNTRWLKSETGEVEFSNFTFEGLVASTDCS